MTLLHEHGSSGEQIDSDLILEIFCQYVADLGITMYPAQEEAILELLAHRHVILNTPTGSGKSLVALALHFQGLAEGRVSYYTAPTKALVNEKFFSLCDALGAKNVGLVTGDGAVNGEAKVICCTAEVLANKSLRDEVLAVDYVVMDEFHYFGDKDRGTAWQIPLLTMPDSVFLLMSATLGDVSAISKRLESFTDRPVSVIKGQTRPVPLSFEYRESALHETVEQLVENGLAPVYLVNFTQRACAEQAQNLMSINVTSKEEKREIGKQLTDVKFDTPYGKEFSRFIRHGIGVHHAGLLPKYRRVVERLSQQGLVKVISGTDTLGVGVNIPIRTVLFSQLYKFDGEKMGIVGARAFHQIAGRAGRRGFDDFGLVVALAPPWVIENKKRDAKVAKNPHLKKKLRKVSPPPRSVPYDEQTFLKLQQQEPEPLKPVLAVSHGMIVNLLQGASDTVGGGLRRLTNLIYHAYVGDDEKKRLRKQAAHMFRSLRQADVVSLERRSDGPGSVVVVGDHLQKEFSLNHALSLYVVQTAQMLEFDEQIGVKMLSLVEAILENPDAVLFRQVDKAKDTLMAQLKADGVPYEERMEKLEKVEYPKPLVPFVYESFNAFCQTHPWVAGENIRPKSVAREMFEWGCDFNYYVQQYGLARSEGVLLRYLSQVYKAAVQTVPQPLWDETFEDILAYLHGLVSRVDASLLEEWALLAGASNPEAVKPSKPARQPSIADDPRAFKARVRNEIHALLFCLANKDWSGASATLWQAGEFPCSPEEIERQMERFYAEYEQVDVTPLARQSRHTVIRPDGHRRWKVSHRILSSEGDDEYGIEALVDLRGRTDETEPFIELVHIGL